VARSTLMTVFAVPGGIRHPSRRDAGPSLGAAMGETPPPRIRLYWWLKPPQGKRRVPFYELEPPVRGVPGHVPRMVLVLASSTSRGRDSFQFPGQVIELRGCRYWLGVFFSFTRENELLCFCLVIFSNLLQLGGSPSDAWLVLWWWHSSRR
jgi:hypothetical protein